LEAAQRGLPVVFGPHMENFKEIAAMLAEGGGGFQISTKVELYEQIRAWLVDPEKCQEEGKKAQAAMQPHQGAVSRNLEIIRRLLENPKAG
ncbi:MAG: hypothetical protein LJE88_13110, partial [Deltaproteobacteria bacterium]|nr:hypothetical protein [Deltaproteobacteria bacterium]